eukprot:1391595-Alexandrium_andersonii.AAC.1
MIRAAIAQSKMKEAVARRCDFRPRSVLPLPDPTRAKLIDVFERGGVVDYATVQRFMADQATAWE